MRILKPTVTSLIIVLASGLILLTFFLRPSWQIGGDGFGYYAYVRSALFDHNLNLTNEFQYFDAHYNRQSLSYYRTPTGKTGDPFSIGPSILWLPFVLVADGVQHVGHVADPNPISGYNTPYQVAVALGTWAYALLGAGLLFLALARLTRPWPAWWATLSIFGISPLWYYLIYGPSMAHGMSFATGAALFALAVHFFKKPERTLWHALGLGALVGLAFLVRWQDVLIGLIPLATFFRGTLRRQVTEWCGWIVGGFLLVSWPQFVVWQKLYGAFLTIPQSTSFFSLSHPHLWQFLTSAQHGMFAVHPLLLIGLAGMLWAIKAWPLLIWPTLVVLFAEIYLNAGLNDWFGGASFGARRMVSVLFAFALGLAFVLSKAHRLWQRATLTAIIIIAMLFNLGLAVAYARGYLPLEAPTTLHALYTEPFRALLHLRQ